MTTVTYKIAEVLSPGMKLIALVNFGSIHGNCIIKDEIYTIKEVVDNNSFIFEEGGGGWCVKYGGVHQFALVDTKNIKGLLIVKEVKELVKKANKGRESADVLLRDYADKITVQNGRYILK